jgi:alkane 1-monooxygenase
MPVRALPFCLVFVLPLSAALGLLLGGLWPALTLLLVFVLVPVLDALLGINSSNPAPGTERALAACLRFRVINWACLPALLALVAWACVLSVRMPLWAYALSAASVGTVSGAMGIVTAHELVHRASPIEQAAGYALLLPSLYMHWGIEHVLGHHKNVATPLDPASARRGESFYRFLPRTLWGTYVGAWRLEVRRLRKSERRPWGPSNRMIGFTLLSIVPVVGLWLGLGRRAALFFVLQASVAVVLLELTNYIEHYGLRRRETATGVYEPVTPLHSWNASHWVTNFFLFHLQRHSDHHFRASRRYQVLRHFEESPQLPNGYAGMVLLALLPPLWFRVMDSRLDGLPRPPGPEPSPA